MIVCVCACACVHLCILACLVCCARWVCTGPSREEHWVSSSIVVPHYIPLRQGLSLNQKLTVLARLGSMSSRIHLFLSSDAEVITPSFSVRLEIQTQLLMLAYTHSRPLSISSALGCSLALICISALQCALRLY